MIGSPLFIVETVRRTLADRVLPQLEASSWLAGDVRSSMMLLTYLEDVLASGKTQAGQANEAMAAFLDDAAGNDALPFLTAALRDQAREAAATARAVDAGDLIALEAANRVLKDATSAVIGASHEEGAIPTPEFTDRLRQCLRDVAACEQALSERAGQMTPF